MASVYSKPTRNDERVRTLDFCRGIAVLGIFLCNICFMALPAEGVMSFSYRETVPFLQNYMFIWSMFFDGTQRGLFSLLFGIGMLIFLQRNSEKIGAGPAADLYFRRITFLFLFGLVNAYLFLWAGDILAPYALFTFLAFAFRNASQKMLITISTVLILISSLAIIPSSLSTLGDHEAYQQAQVLVKNGSELSEEQQAAVDKWEKKPDPAEIKESVKVINAGLSGVWEHHIAELGFVLSFIYYSFFLDCIPLFFLGIVLYRMGVFKPDYPLAKLVYPGALLVMVAWLWRYVDAHYTTAVLDRVILAYISPFSPIVRTALTIGYALLLVGGYRYLYQLFIAKAVVATGQMALTNYLSQSIIGALVFYGLGLYGALNGAEIALVVFFVWGWQLTISPIWLHYFRFGPFEWMWRSLTYGQWQPFRKPSVRVNVATTMP